MNRAKSTASQRASERAPCSDTACTARRTATSSVAARPLPCAMAGIGPTAYFKARRAGGGAEPRRSVSLRRPLVLAALQAAAQLLRLVLQQLGDVGVDVEEHRLRRGKARGLGLL